MPCVLEALINKVTKDQTKSIIENQITPWAFFYTSKGVSVKRFNGKSISYSGIKFFGSPVEVFWNGYIEPYIEDFIINSINLVSLEIRENNIKDPKQELNYLGLRLYSSIEKIYEEMQKIDQTLKNSPLEYKKNAARTKIHHQIANMQHFVDQYISMENKKFQCRTINIVKDLFYNPYVVPIITSIIAAAAITFLKLN